IQDNIIFSRDSVDLHCSVLTDKCVGNHNTHPGIIYKHGNINDQCEKNSEKDSHVQSCIYNDGIYYCAVAMCGEILFGNGSRLEIGVLVATNILWLVIIAILLCTVRKYKNDKKHFLVSHFHIKNIH
uniref:Uncharacterized protein n=1 Tax=Cyprinus carpio TaxID=7962 RepID=A0A8C2JVM1_CYPCA